MRPRNPQEILKMASTRAFLVTDSVNLRYLTGLALSAGALLVLPKRFFLFVDGRYRYAAERDIRRGISVRDLQDLPRVLEKLRSSGYESETVTVDRYRFWKRKFPHTKFVHTKGVIAEFRRSKESDELRVLKRAERITEELLRRVPSVLRKGISEIGVARKLQIWALELGAEGLSFDPIVGFGTHTSSPHHHPTTRTLKRGHIVQIDVGAKVNGYCADRSEVYFTGKPTPLQERVYATLSEARDRAMKAAKAGASTRALDAVARKILHREGFEEAFTHALGHGVGLEIHEGVSLSAKAPDQKLHSGEVITIEPGVYFDGKFGMRVESMVYVE